MDRPDLEPARPLIQSRVPGVVFVIIVVALTLAGLTASWGLPAPVRLASPEAAAVSPSPSLVSPPTPIATAALAARPAWVNDLAGQLECDGPPADFGQEVPTVAGPMDPAGGPDQALDIARLLYWNLPAKGFEPTQIESGWARHRYLVGGRIKAIVVSTNVFKDVPTETGWEVVGLRACDPSELRPEDLGPMAGTVWLDADGRPSRTELVTSFSGPGHCGWESTVFLTYDQQQYFRDPNHVLREYTVTTFDATSRLPDDAVDTGLHTQEWHLFTIPSGRAVFMRTGDGRIELWPRARESIGCM